MEELYALLENLRPDVDFREESKLIDNGILDSFDIITLVANLSEEFEIEIRPAELVPENFNSADSLWAMIQRLQEE